MRVISTTFWIIEVNDIWYPIFWDTLYLLSLMVCWRDKTAILCCQVVSQMFSDNLQLVHFSFFFYVCPITISIELIYLLISCWESMSSHHYNPESTLWLSQVQYMSHGSAFAILPICISSLGILLTLITIIILVKNRDTPLVRASGKQSACSHVLTRYSFYLWSNKSTSSRL